MTVLIAGGGISGLALALSCEQVGIPFKVFEATRELKPLGVGINLQPSAVRELYSLGLQDQLGAIGIRTKDYGMYSKKGLRIWTEPRGIDAGYNWPQYSVHRGKLLMLLYDALVNRAGPDAVETGWRATGFENDGDQAVLHLVNGAGETRVERGAVLIGADGIHSTVRAQMEPNEGAPIWGGTILWRGVTRAKPFLTGASMVMVGHDLLRFVSYPISQADPVTGEALVNWIATRKFDPAQSYRREDYSRQADLGDFLTNFQGFRFDWLDAPALIEAAEQVFEYPMVDRDPLERWTYDRVTLMGDAAHAAYPVGSNGAGSGILDARKLTAAFLQHGLSHQALQAFEDEMRPLTSRVVLTNRGAGPDKILDVIEDRCGGDFADIEDVISRQEMEDLAATYKRIAGFGIEETNETPEIIPKGAVFSG